MRGRLRGLGALGNLIYELGKVVPGLIVKFRPLSRGARDLRFLEISHTKSARFLIFLKQLAYSHENSVDWSVVYTHRRVVTLNRFRPLIGTFRVPPGIWALLLGMLSAFLDVALDHA